MDKSNLKRSSSRRGLLKLLYCLCSKKKKVKKKSTISEKNRLENGYKRKQSKFFDIINMIAHHCWAFISDKYKTYVGAKMNVQLLIVTLYIIANLWNRLSLSDGEK